MAYQAASNLRSKTFLKLTQLGFWDRKHGEATTEADHNLREYPDNGLVTAFRPGKMDVHLRAELSLFFRATRAAGHSHFLPLSFRGSGSGRFPRGQP